MARTINYDPDTVIRGAMRVFWEKGYEATSVADLVKATKLNTRSMYNAYGDKNGLFIETLKAYRKDYLLNCFNLVKNGSGKKAIFDYFLCLSGNSYINGCFFVNTLTEKKTLKKAPFVYVDNYFKNLEHLFFKRLVESKQEGSFLLDPTLVAKQLVIIIQGISTYSKMISDMKVFVPIIMSFLTILDII